MIALIINKQVFEKGHTHSVCIKRKYLFYMAYLIDLLISLVQTPIKQREQTIFHISAEKWNLDILQLWNSWGEVCVWAGMWNQNRQIFVSDGISYLFICLFIYFWQICVAISWCKQCEPDKSPHALFECCFCSPILRDRSIIAHDSFC